MAVSSRHDQPDLKRSAPMSHVVTGHFGHSS